MIRSVTRFAALVAMAFSFATTVVAQDYPAKPIRMIIPFPPGGSNDIVGRLIAQQLSDKLGKQVVVDNRAGAGGVIGTELAAAAAPDGYTLLVVSLAHAVNPWLYKLKYDPIKSFAPIALFGSGPIVMVVNPAVPATSVKELIALAKKDPGKLNLAHAGVGSFQHLGSSLFLSMTGSDIVQIPFKGGGPAMIDVVAGHSQVMLGSLVQTTPHIKAGKLRPLGVGGLKRSPSLPDVPTIAEAGVPGYHVENWWGVVAPAGTPPAIIERLQKELTAIQGSADVQKTLSTEGAEVVKMDTAEFTKYIEMELTKWQKVVKDSNIKAE